MRICIYAETEFCEKYKTLRKKTTCAFTSNTPSMQSLKLWPFVDSQELHLRKIEFSEKYRKFKKKN